jgi:hypothetical protein
MPTLAGAAAAFVDIGESVHKANIELIAAAGVTRGCNPPVNDRFCPDRPVTRAEMATFLVRVLGLQRPLTEGSFIDTGGSPHATNIEAIALAGITTGCNPPANDRFCPDRPVSRAEIATFLVRALDLVRVKGRGSFVDTLASPHATNIATIAAYGITIGCNPPTNDRFCPDRHVTRAEMATFLVRAIPELKHPSATTTTSTTPTTQATTTTSLEDHVIFVPFEAPTIQAGIDLAEDGWTVLVNTGIYHERLDFKGKEITVVSVAGPNGTYLNAGGLGPAVSFHAHEPPEAVLDGFTIWGGDHDLFWQGDVCNTGVGGGISIVEASPTIRNVVLETNEATYGSGIGILNGSPTIDGAVLNGDNVYVRHIHDPCNPNPTLPVPSIEVVFNHLRIINGGAAGTDGMHVSGIDALVTGTDWRLFGDSTLEANLSGSTIEATNLFIGSTLSLRNGARATLTHASLRVLGWAVVASGPLTMSDSIVWAEEVAFSCDQPASLARVLVHSVAGTEFDGNCLDGSEQLVVADPLFTDPQTLNYTPAAGSPAIDAGLVSDPVTVDIDARQRVDGDGDGLVEADLGAWEAPEPP